jgi:hypothetical protein
MGQTCLVGNFASEWVSVSLYIYIFIFNYFVSMLDHHGNLLEMIRGQVQELARQSKVGLHP